MESKLKELVVYIAQKSENDPAFGLTKLNKILFISDFIHYAHYGKAITDEVYVHRKNGPVPQRIHTILSSLESAQRIRIVPNDYFGHEQKRVVPIGGANLSKFNDNEIGVVDSFIDMFSKYNGTELSEWTHTLTPWLETTNEEIIPYPAVFMLKKLPVRRDGIDWARKELRHLRDECGYAY